MWPPQLKLLAFLVARTPLPAVAYCIWHCGTMMDSVHLVKQPCHTHATSQQARCLMLAPRLANCDYCD